MGFLAPPIMPIGCARIPNHEENLTPQLDVHNRAGCRRLLRDRVSSVEYERPGLKAVLENAKPGDTLLVRRPDDWEVHPRI